MHARWSLDLNSKIYPHMRGLLNLRIHMKWSFPKNICNSPVGKTKQTSGSLPRDETQSARPFFVWCRLVGHPNAHRFWGKVAWNEKKASKFFFKESECVHHPLRPGKQESLFDSTSLVPKLSRQACRFLFAVPHYVCLAICAHHEISISSLQLHSEQAYCAVMRDSL